MISLLSKRTIDIAKAAPFIFMVQPWFLSLIAFFVDILGAPIATWDYRFFESHSKKKFRIYIVLCYAVSIVYNGIHCSTVIKWPVGIFVSGDHYAHDKAYE